MKFKYRKLDDGQWHERYAWMPIKVEDEHDQNTMIWFEKYMQKSSWKAGEWERLSKKKYFEKKLKGEFDEIKEDGSPMANTDMGQVSSPISNLQDAMEIHYENPRELHPLRNHTCEVHSSSQVPQVPFDRP